MVTPTGSIASTSNVNQHSDQLNQHNSPLSASESLQEFLEINIEAISQLRAGEQEKESYINNCINNIVQAVPKCDFADLELEKDYATFEKHLNLFNNIVDKSGSLSEEDKQSIKTDVKRACQNGIAEKWMANCTQRFHSLFLLSTLETRSSAAQEWTQQFFVGANLYFDLMNINNDNTTCVPESVIKKAEHAFEKEYQSWIKQQGETIQRLVEQNTHIFNARLMDITKRAREDFYSLLAEEKELLEGAINIAAPQAHPLFIMKLGMMKACLSTGNLLHENGLSIAESEEAKRVFLAILTRLKEGVTDYFLRLKLSNNNS